MKSMLNANVINIYVDT